MLYKDVVKTFFNERVFNDTIHLHIELDLPFSYIQIYFLWNTKLINASLSVIYVYK